MRAPSAAPRGGARGHGKIIEGNNSSIHQDERWADDFSPVISRRAPRPIAAPAELAERLERRPQLASRGVCFVDGAPLTHSETDICANCSNWDRVLRQIERIRRSVGACT